MKKWNRVLNSIMITFAAVTVIRFIVDFVYWNILRPEVYATYSAPWYTAGLLYCALTAILILVCCVMKLILKRRDKKQNDR